MGQLVAVGDGVAGFEGRRDAVLEGQRRRHDGHGEAVQRQALEKRDKMRRNGGEESLQPVDPESTVCQLSTANESRLLGLSASRSHSHARLVLLSKQGVNVSSTGPNKVQCKEEGRRRQDKKGKGLRK